MIGSEIGIVEMLQTMESDVVRLAYWEKKNPQKTLDVNWANFKVDSENLERSVWRSLQESWLEMLGAGARAMTGELQRNKWIVLVFVWASLVA